MARPGSAGVAALACAGVLSACTVVPLGSTPVSLVAYPGADKTPAQFAQDDGVCRGVAAPVASQPVPNASAPPPAETSAPVQPTPESVYFSCMTSHGNVVAAAPTAQYAYAYPYAVYPYGPLYAGLFADEFLLDRRIGLYGGFRGGYGYGYGDGWRGRGWGGRDWGGREWGGRGFRR